MVSEEISVLDSYTHKEYGEVTVQRIENNVPSTEFNTDDDSASVELPSEDEKVVIVFYVEEKASFLREPVEEFLSSVELSS